MKTFFGTLHADSAIRGRSVQTPDPFDGYSVVAYFTVQDGPETRLIERRFPVRADGGFTLSLSETALADEDLRLAVVHPGGETLATTPLRMIRRDADTRLEPVSVTRPTPGFRPSEIALTASLTRSVTARILSPSGNAGAAAGQRVSVTGITAEGRRIALWSGVTDRQGYFRMTVTNRSMASATLSIGAETAQKVLPVTLRDGFLPDPLIVVTEIDADPDACPCDLVPPELPGPDALATQGESFSQDLGTACQTMTTPNRTLEEFDYFQIVRTTDPSIRGTGREREPAGDIVTREMSKIVFDQGTLAAETRASHVMTDRAAAASSARAMMSTRTLTTEERALVEVDRARDDMVRVTGGSASLNRLAAEAVRGDALLADGVAEASRWRGAVEQTAAADALQAALARIPAEAISAALTDPDGFTPVKVMTMERRATAQALQRYLGLRNKTVPGRGALNEDNPVDWDMSPEFYMATSVAHGHILQFKQEWKADGYSLGDLLQSIPLAPGQQKQIVTLDWDRSDRASLRETTIATEELEAELSRDRDINEIANAQLTENISGRSSAKTGAVGGGLGLAIGPLVIGGGGGGGWASSNASSNGLRAFSADTLNTLRDRTSQAASSVRQQRSTAVRTVRQRERVSATSEVISNFNRCHALTVQYFEVLRHFAVHERLAGVRECLFVPLEMKPFESTKVLRWRRILERACGDRSLRRGFDAIERLSSPATTPPDARFADDPIEAMSGRLRFRLSIARPKDPSEAERAVLEQSEWRFFGIMLGVAPETIYSQYRRNEAQKEHVFRTEIAPDVADAFLRSLDVVLIDRDGNAHPSGFDLTVTSRYQEGGVMEVELNDAATASRLPRAEIAGLEIRATRALPDFSKVILEDAFIGYRTQRLRHRLVSRTRIHDDVDINDAAFVSCADLSWIEERNKLLDDQMRRRRLLRHLNDNIEFYHRAIWLGMDPNRRYMLMDGFEAPNARGRSIASVVENRVIGVVGNCLVLPVAPGFQLDPILREALEDADDPQEALDRIYAIPPSPPRRLSVPTRGVFGEAIAGTCKSCEVIDEDRFWRWSNYPLPDSPPPIAALSTDSRFADMGTLTPTPFPEALIKYQTIPDAPAPTGMAAALGMLAKDVFKDMSGLSLNQQNALAGLTASLGAAQSFAGGAMELALARDKAQSLDRTLGQIEGAKTAGYLTGQQASTAARDALMQSFGGSKTPTAQPATASPEVSKALQDASKTPGASASITSGHGDETETVAFATEAPDPSAGIGAAPVFVWLDHHVWVDVALIEERGIGTPPPITISISKTDHGTGIDAARRRMKTRVRFDAAGDAVEFDAFGNPLTAAVGIGMIDLAQSALDAGFLRENPDPAKAGRFQVRVDMRIGYPGKSGSRAVPRAVHFPHSGKRKLPLALIIHGQSASWTPTGARKRAVTIPAPVAMVPGTPAHTIGLKNRASHEGYRPLQEKLALEAEPVISVSVSVNFANAIQSLVETRSLLAVEALRALKAEIAAKADHALRDAIDFDSVCVIGHSRGGEAAAEIAANNRGAGVFKVTSVLALAPTDFYGSTAAPITVTDPNQSYFCLWGGLDGDVSGAEQTIRFAGSGLRSYDRVPTNKVFLFAPQCTHNGFNSNWPAGSEWRKTSGATLVADPQPGVASDAQHEALLAELGWAFCDLTLNGTVSHQALFRAVDKPASGLKLAAQSRFGSQILVIDDFEGAAANAGTRTLGPHMTREDISALELSLPGDVGERKTHVSHLTRVAVLDLAAAAGRSVLSYDLSAVQPAQMAGKTFDMLQLRLGSFYPISPQGTIDAHPLPDFVIRVTEMSGDVFEAKSADLYARLGMGVGTPQVKTMDGNTVTQMALHTVHLERTDMTKSTGEIMFLPIFSEMKTLEIDFSMSAAGGEIWIDSVELVRV